MRSCIGAEGDRAAVVWIVARFADEGYGLVAGCVGLDSAGEN